MNTSERLNERLQKLADSFGIKKAEFVKNLVVKNFIFSRKNSGKKLKKEAKK